MRVFIGLRFGYQVKNYLRSVQEAVKGTSSSGNYTKFDNFHLTLNFIGKTTNAETDEIIDHMYVAATNHAPFELKIGGISSFSQRGKHTVFTEVTGGLSELKSLQGELTKVLTEHEYISEKRRYKPHITLAREVLFNDVSYLKTVPLFDGTVTIDSIVLFESKRNKHGELVYEVIEEVPLRENKGGNNSHY